MALCIELQDTRVNAGDVRVQFQQKIDKAWFVILGRIANGMRFGD